MKLLLKALSVILCSVLLSVCVSGEGWYCAHKENGEIPPLPPEFSFLREAGGVYINADAAKGGEKVIYLTFDAGYENGNVEKILDVLKEKEVTGAFFILENLLLRNEELVRRMADEGHLVCNHTAKHKNITRISEDELREEISGLYDECDKRNIKMAKFFRPPEGEMDEKSVRTVKEMGYTTVMWSFAYADWDNAKQPSAESAMKKIMKHLHCGEIILLHPTSATNAAIIGELVDRLKEQGWRFGSLEELV